MSVCVSLYVPTTWACISYRCTQAELLESKETLAAMKMELETLAPMKVCGLV